MKKEKPVKKKTAIKKVKKKIVRKKPVKKKTAIKKVKQENQGLVSGVSDETLDKYIFGNNMKFNPEQKTLFKETAKAMNLNPFKKEIFAVPYEVKDYNAQLKKKVSRDPKEYTLTIMIGYPTFLKRAENLNDLEYWKIDEFGEINMEKPQLSNYKAITTIKRKSRSAVFTWVTRFVEVAPRDNFSNIRLNSFWKKQPTFQTRKCCFAQAFRIYFPNEMSGIPYIQEEVEAQKAEEIKDVTPEVVGPELFEWGKDERELFGKITDAWKLLGKDVDQFKEAFKIKSDFRELDINELKKIHKALNEELDKNTIEADAKKIPDQEGNKDG